MHPVCRASLADAVFNFAGAVATTVLESLKNRPDVTIGGLVYTGPRIFLFATWLAVLFTQILVVCCLRWSWLHLAARATEADISRARFCGR